VASVIDRQIGVVMHQRNSSIRVILEKSGSTLLAGTACVYPVLVNQQINLSPASIVLVGVQSSVTKIFGQAPHRIHFAFTEDLVWELLQRLVLFEKSQDSRQCLLCLLESGGPMGEVGSEATRRRLFGSLHSRLCGYSLLLRFRRLC
jgi:hypothetical protein